MNSNPIRYASLFALTAFLSIRCLAAMAPPVMVEAEAEANFDLRCTLNFQGTKAPNAPAVLLGYQPGGSYLSVTFSSGALTLNRVVKGRTTAVSTVKQRTVRRATKGTPVVLQWREGNLRVIYDGHTILRQGKLSALNGGVAVVEEKGNPQLTDPEVQPVEPVQFADDFMRSATVPGLWETTTGTWKLNTAGDPNLGANPFSYIATGKPAMAIVGRWFWSDYIASASVKPSGDGAVGLIACWQDDKNYLLCKWYAANAPGAPATKKQLWRVLDGEPTLLAAAPGGYQPQQWYRLSMGAADGLVKMLVDGTPALEKRTDLFGQGKAGLFADSEAEAMFDDVQVQPADEVLDPEEDQVASGPARFAKDQSMEDWASPKGQWLPAPTTLTPSSTLLSTPPATPAAAGTPAAPITTTALWWNRGTFFGNYAVEIKATGIAAGAKVQAILAGDGVIAESGYAIEVKPTPDNKSLESVLLRNGKPVTPTVITTLPDITSCQIKLQRTGNTLNGFIGRTPVAAFTDPKPLAGRRAGYEVEMAQVAFADAHVTGGNMTDYTFFRAPTDWQVGSGTWDMASRWICTPGWSWYAGWSDRIAAVWNKKSFEGDFAIEVFAASKMDSPTPPYYLHPRDLNITVSGDGRDLASGYSFVFGGWNNTATRILRGTQTVAETDQVLLPTSATYHATSHHKWFCLRVEKTGDTISYYVDRKLALQYKDPKPLTGKRIALWTSGNGIMIARATIYDEKQGGVELVPAALTVTNDLPSAPAEKLNWQVRGADPTVSLTAIAPSKSEERPAVRAVNVGGGGNFAIAPQIEPFDALQTPKLTFQCRLDAGAEVNLYLRVKGATHVVQLNGPTPDKDAEDAKSIGAVGMLADGKWHDVTLDLAALLKPLYPAETSLTVEEIFIGNLARDTYLQAGFGANYPGTSYLIRGFALRSPDGQIIKRIDPQLNAQSKTR
jgi:hypothetical protein